MLPYEDALLKWADELDGYQPPVWTTLPDIDLYMDQVITYLERQMAIFTQTEEEKSITPAMINNYVKNEVMPRPVQKKYTREHLAYLMAVLNLKQVLSLSEITRLIADEITETPVNKLFDAFNAIQEEAMKNTSSRLKESITHLEEGILTEQEAEKRLRWLSLKLSLEANASRLAAKRILAELKAHKAKTSDDKAKEREKDKEKEKAKDRSKSKDTEKEL
ncbi:MAG: DUF1836 domain-containing protein [Clostridia bacterium]|nr:DUF1836 domain-containing protein [Clostridia bacterium]